jgi:hypothetical protein
MSTLTRSPETGRSTYQPLSPGAVQATVEPLVVFWSRSA